MSGLFPPLHSRSRRGMALIITLGTVVLITILVIAFLTRAQLARQVSFSETNLIKADCLVRSALDIVVGELRDEITDPNHSNSTTVGAVTLYPPLTTTDWLPRAAGVSGATGSLLKVSGAGIPVRPGGTIVGSNVPIDASSANGRLLSASRWFTSTTSSPQLGTQATLPTWLFCTRSNGVETPAIDKAKDPSSNEYVVGRFAYTVYDTSGLFDVTLAGCPGNNPFATPAQDIGLKASTSYANLAVLGFSASSLDNFYSWRNAITGTDAATFLEWASGIRRTSGTPSAPALAVAQSGHREIALGDNTPLNRHDLLANPNLSEVPGAITHFSRFLNSPTYAPPAPTATNPNLATLRFSAAGAVTHYHDDATTESYSAQVGDIFLQRRFSLAKLAWLTYKGPSADLPAGDALYNAGGTDAAIQACFGLKWTTLAIGGISTTCWKYVGSLVGSSNATSIETLSAVAGESREPNFFELLKAGIKDDSLGRSSDLTTLADPTFQATLEKSRDLQILRIGACAIDSADADNYPTTITLSVSGTDTPVHGIEDLPYIFALSTAVINDDTYTAATDQHKISWMSCVSAPMFFNPHQASAPSVGPLAIRSRILRGKLDQIEARIIGYTGTQPTSNFTSVVDMNFGSSGADLTTPSAEYISFPASAFENFRPALKCARSTDNANVASELQSLVPQYTTPTNVDLSAFRIYRYAPPLSYNFPDPTRTLCAYFSNLQVVLEYQDAGGWHIYDTLTGNEAFGSGSGIGGANYVQMYGNFVTKPTPLPFGWSHGNVGIGYGQSKFDPRTTRFGVMGNSNFNVHLLTPLTSTANGTYNPGTFWMSLPFSPAYPALPASLGPLPGEWAEGGKVAWSTAQTRNIADPDGTVRPADAWLDGTNANPYRNLNDPTCRPAILQRPFRSVAELGQVFRDNPGKTLDFFDQTSGEKALLDLFSVADEPAVAAGRVELNATQTKVQQALFTGAAQAPDGTAPLSAPGQLASAYNAYAFSSGVPTSALPTSPGGLVDFLSSLPVGGAMSLSAIKSRREAVVRSLAGTTQTRTWNLLIDMVAQTGRYAPTASSLQDFIVEGEHRYWLSIAIDRLTGKVISQQLESADD